jgi:hypothetical protein
MAIDNDQIANEKSVQIILFGTIKGEIKHG